MDSICTENNICEAVGCSIKATKMIRVNLGPKGAVKLFLCENCQSKFGPDFQPNGGIET
jgi:hypothetical protein